MIHTSRMNVPFNRPCFAGSELAYIAEALEHCGISGDGRFTAKCQELLERELEVPKVLLTTSGTHALEMAALLLDFEPGDEVIVPSFTFVSTANAFALRGARPVFVDIRPDTLNIDAAQLDDRVTPRTKAIVLVHYAGVGSDMDAILGIARRSGVAVVEDNAHGLFGKYKGRYLGTLGCLGTQSFHETKNITCGEGGALLINDPQFLRRAEVVHQMGTNRRSFFRGEVEKYTWIDLGSSYIVSDILAAVLFAQLERRERIRARRRETWECYMAGLRDWAGQHDVRLPTVPSGCEPAYHLFFLLLPGPVERDHFIARLKAQGIGSASHYLPLHLSAMGQRFGGVAGQCPVAERVSACLVRLPLYDGLTGAEHDHVIEVIHQVRW